MVLGKQTTVKNRNKKKIIVEVIIDFLDRGPIKKKKLFEKKKGKKKSEQNTSKIEGRGNSSIKER